MRRLTGLSIGPTALRKQKETATWMSVKDTKNETKNGSTPGSGTGDLARAYHPKRQKRSIKVDAVAAADLARFTARIFCDDCGHYDRTGDRCTMGYLAQHTRAAQMAFYELSGKMAFCRFIEID
jgi:hypothetical protein